MLNSETLEVAIGMVFLFLLMSLICTAIKEWIEALLKWRAMDLERAMRNLLDDPDGSTTQALYSHPIIYSLFQGSYDAAQLRRSRLTMGTGAGKHMRLGARRNLPSYIPTAHFATAFIDFVARGATTPGAAAPDAAVPGPLTIDLLRAQAARLPDHLGRTVIAGIDYANGDIAKVRKAVEQWFDGAMDRASGWYKRRTQALLFIVGLLTAVVLNVDALHILHRMTADKTFRDVVVSHAAAAKAPASSAAGGERDAIAQARGELDAVAMPIGWESPDADATWPLWPTQFCNARPGADGTVVEQCRFRSGKVFSVLRLAVGWLITAFAIMLGAPFWFDVLNRIMIIRSTVKPHEKSPEEPSQDGGDAAKVQRLVLSTAPAPAPPPVPSPPPAPANDDAADAAPQPAA
jgi:hypothetical protein